jgi:hypothetical protein
VKNSAENPPKQTKTGVNLGCGESRRQRFSPCVGLHLTPERRARDGQAKENLPFNTQCQDLKRWFPLSSASTSLRLSGEIMGATQPGNDESA